MIPLTSPAWKHFPELKFVQFPWRWLLCLNVPFALFLTLAWRRWASRLLACSLLLLVLAYAWHRVQPPWWDASSDIAEMLDDQQTGHGYEGTDEYVPAGVDAYEIAQDAPIATGDGAGPVPIQIQLWDARAKLFTAQASLPARIYLRLFNYPAWKVKVNGRLTRTDKRAVTGQMVIPIQPGMSRVSIAFATTWDRTIGLFVSLLTLLVIVTLKWRQRLHPVDLGTG